MARHHSKKGIRTVFLAAVTLGTILFFGCSGDNGDTGATGPAGPPGPAGPVTTTSESCVVCHSAGKTADIAVAHPDPTGLDVTLSNITLTNTGGIPVVTFNAATSAGPVTDLVFSDVQVYMANLVPANTETNWGTWPTAYFERWAAENSSTAGATFDDTNAAAGNYTYTFATGFGSRSGSGSRLPITIRPTPSGLSFVSAAITTPMATP